MKNILIVSAGKFGREVLGYVYQAIQAGAPWRVKGFLDSRPNVLDGFSYDEKIIASPDTYCPEKDDVFLCGLGDPVMKKHYAEALEARGANFINLVHPLANVGRNVKLGRGVILAPYCALTSDLTLGNHVTISSFTGVAHDVSIGDYCQISGHCGVNGNVVLEDGVFLGTHTALVPGAVVGAWSYVGAGSVVLRRVAPYTKVFGNPAQKIGTMPGPPGVVAKNTVTIP